MGRGKGKSNPCLHRGLGLNPLCHGRSSQRSNFENQESPGSGIQKADHCFGETDWNGPSRCLMLAPWNSRSCPLCALFSSSVTWDSPIFLQGCSGNLMREPKQTLLAHRAWHRGRHRGRPSINNSPAFLNPGKRSPRTVTLNFHLHFHQITLGHPSFSAARAFNCN